MEQSPEWSRHNTSHQAPRSRTRGTRAASRRQTPFLFVALIAAAGLLAAAGALLWFYADQGGDSGQTARIARTEQSVRGFPIQPPLAHQYYPFTSDYVLRVTSDYVSFIDEDANTAQSYRVELSDPRVVVNGNFALIYDFEAENYYLFDEEGLHLYGTGSAPIQSASLSPGGNFLLIMQDSYSRGIVRVMDVTGRHRFDREFFDLQDSGFLVNAAFTHQDDAVDISLVNTDGMDADAVFYRFSLDDYSTVWHYRIEEARALPLMAHDEEGTLYSSDGENIWQISEYGPVLWHDVSGAKHAVAGHGGVWKLAADGITLSYIPWSSPAAPSQTARETVFRLPENNAAWHLAGDKIVTQRSDGSLMIQAADGADERIMLPHAAGELQQILWHENGYLQIVTNRQVLWLDVED